VFCVITGIVKKVGAFRIVHEKYKGGAGKKEEVKKKFHQELEEALRQNKEIKPWLSKAQEVCHLNPAKL
jgi:hypothetical protein